MFKHQQSLLTVNMLSSLHSVAQLFVLQHGSGESVAEAASVVVYRLVRLGSNPTQVEQKLVLLFRLCIFSDYLVHSAYQCAVKWL